LNTISFVICLSLLSFATHDSWAARMPDSHLSKKKNKAVVLEASDDDAILDAAIKQTQQEKNDLFLSLDHELASELSRCLAAHSSSFNLTNFLDSAQKTLGDLSAVTQKIKKNKNFDHQDRVDVLSIAQYCNKSINESGFLTPGILAYLEEFRRANLGVQLASRINSKNGSSYSIARENVLLVEAIYAKINKPL